MFLKIRPGNKTDQRDTVEISIKFDQIRSGTKLNFVTKVLPVINNFDHNETVVILAR